MSETAHADPPADNIEAPKPQTPDEGKLSLHEQMTKALNGVPDDIRERALAILSNATQLRLDTLQLVADLEARVSASEKNAGELDRRLRAGAAQPQVQRAVKAPTPSRTTAKVPPAPKPAAKPVSRAGGDEAHATGPSPTKSEPVASTAPAKAPAVVPAPDGSKKLSDDELRARIALLRQKLDAKR